MKNIEEIENLIERKKYKDVLTKLKTIGGINSDSRLLFFAGQALLGLGAREQALVCYKQSYTLNPSDVQCRLSLAELLALIKRNDEAVTVIETLDSQGDLTDKELYRLAGIYSQCDVQEKALNLFEALYKRGNKNVDLYYNLAISYKYSGRFDESVNFCKKALDANPFDFDAYYLLVQLSEVHEQLTIDRLVELSSSGNLNHLQQSKVNYALSKVYEDNCEFQKAFYYADRGAKLRRQLLKYDVKVDIQSIKSIATSYVSRQSNVDCKIKPIFVTGLPRSGTTLVERILGSHDEVTGCGELNDFSQSFLTQLGRDRTIDPVSYKDIYNKLDFAAVGNEYLRRTKLKRKNNATFVDKQPLNFVNAGYIKNSFNNCKIIFVKRNPLDVTWALYKTLFDSGCSYSYDLNEIMQYVLNYYHVVEHWEKSFGKEVYSVNYEDLVVNFEEEVNSLLNYCELDFDKNCLDFYKNSGATSTQSSVQVRKPIYDSSVNKWKRFDKELVKVKEFYINNGIL